MGRKDKEKKKEEIKEVNEKKPSKKDKKKQQKTSEEIKNKKQVIEPKLDRLDLNAYNLLFDEVSLFLNQLNQMKTKEIKQQLILLDGKMLWLEKESDEDLLSEEEEEDIIDMELQMLELGGDLESADELKVAFEATADEFDLNTVKAELAETKSWGQDLKDLLKDIENDDPNKPIDDLMSKFILFELRATLEKAVNEVFRLEGKIKEMMKNNEDKEKIKGLYVDQRIAVKKSLQEIQAKLKKEKPELLLTEEKLNAFKQLTHKKIAEMKAEEEQNLDQIVDELLKD